MKNRKGFAAWCAVLFAAGAAYWAPELSAQGLRPVAMEQPVGQRAPETLQELDEVIVQGTRLADRIIALEDRFYKLYNELNENDDFDVHCAYVDSSLFANDVAADPASRINQRVCNVAFFVDALSEQIRHNAMCERRNDEFDQDDLIDPICYEAPPAELVMLERQQEYMGNLVKVVNSDPRLKAMVMEREALEHEGQMLTNRYAELEALDAAAAERARRRPPARVR